MYVCVCVCFCVLNKRKYANAIVFEAQNEINV